MRKYRVTLAFLAAVPLALSGCAMLGTGNPPIPTTPATPVFFQPLSSSLDQAALTTISEAAKAANEEAGDQVYIIGAADTVGTSDSNKTLSKARAQAVAAQLAADGVATARIHAFAVGEVGAPVDTHQSSRRALIRIGG